MANIKGVGCLSGEEPSWGGPRVFVGQNSAIDSCWRGEAGQGRLVSASSGCGITKVKNNKMGLVPPPRASSANALVFLHPFEPAHDFFFPLSSISRTDVETLTVILADT